MTAGVGSFDEERIDLRLPLMSELLSVATQFVDDCDFTWSIRGPVIRSPHYSLGDLAKFDMGLEALCSGVHATDTESWVFCEQAILSNKNALNFPALILATCSPHSQLRLKTLFIHLRGLVVDIDSCLDLAAWSRSAGKSNLATRAGGNDAPKWFRVIRLAVLRDLSSINVEADRTSISQDIGESYDVIARIVGEDKFTEGISFLRRLLNSEDLATRFWAGWSSILLGDYAQSEVLKTFVDTNSPFAARAMQMTPRVLDPPNAQAWLRTLAQDDTTRRHALKGCGVTGDPMYVPTLISQMSTPEHARVAGEAFSMITGIDLAYDDLDTDWPEGFEAGPTEDPEDENVELDADEDLPWPDQALIQEWWNKNGGAFQAGQRYLCGEIISEANCRRVLIEGFQRQRIAAALELALMNPDEPLFEWRAPGFRQQEWLGLRKPRRRAP